jgi:DNA (cytosine-5)-methyltransferase 1
MRVIDLFAGCGGLSLGLQQAGHTVMAAFERDKFAADTYEHNHQGVSVVRTDIRQLTSDYFKNEFRGQIDLVAGGPPCQGFSVSGNRQYGTFSLQNTLVLEFLRVVDAVKPRFVLMENVGGFRTAKINPTTPALGAVTQALAESGYFVYKRILQAADFGVPQFRTRIFIFGSLNETTVNPFPAPTHSETGVGLSHHVSVWDAISDLPQIESGMGIDDLRPYDSPAHTDYQVRMRRRSPGVRNHVAMNHTPRLIDRFASIPRGGSGYHIGRRTRHDEQEVTVYKMNNQRLRPDLPSLCITANFQSNYIHPTLNRNLTAREAARIMSFPDTFVLTGKRTLMSSSLLRAEGRHDENHLSQYNQLGNAVPPLLARQIGEQLQEMLAAAPGGRTKHDHKPLQSDPVQSVLFA